MNSPYLVTAHNGRAHFFVGNFIPRTMAIAAQNATLKTIIRIAGGMNNIAEEIFPFFRNAMGSIDGSVLMSGGTRCFADDRSIQASVAEVVADLGLCLPHLITMGSFPRTARFGFIDDGHFVVSDGDDTIVNPGTDYTVSIQTGPEDDQKLGWDGDVDAYLEFMASLRDESGFQTGMIVWNGGGVTVNEVQKAHSQGIPIFVITETGRAADNQLSAANFHGDYIHHISKTRPDVLRALLKKYSLSR